MAGRGRLRIISAESVWDHPAIVRRLAVGSREVCEIGTYFSNASPYSILRWPTDLPSPEFASDGLINILRAASPEATEGLSDGEVWTTLRPKARAFPSDATEGFSDRRDFTFDLANLRRRALYDGICRGGSNFIRIDFGNAHNGGTIWRETQPMRDGTDALIMGLGFSAHRHWPQSAMEWMRTTHADRPRMRQMNTDFAAQRVTRMTSFNVPNRAISID